MKYAITLTTLILAPILQAEPWKHITEADGLPTMMVQFMERHGDDIWVGTLQGLAVFRGGRGFKVLAGKATWDIQPLGKGRYWVGTMRGLMLLGGDRKQPGTDSAWKVGDLHPSFKGYSVGSLESLGEKSLLACAERRNAIALIQYKDGDWKAISRFKRRSVSDLFKTRRGKVWAIIESDGIVAADPAKDSKEWAHHLKGRSVRSFCEDKEGRIWCGTFSKGIMELTDGKWKRHLPREESAITTIKQDSKGHLWAATNANGLWQYDGGKWKNHLRDEGTINFLESAGGSVYISSQSAPPLRAWDGKKWQTILDIPGQFRAVVLGPGGKLWAGNTITGLYVQP
ncbi:MAG: two-component regulator propeller domain-containing protein [Planctomycetota bacterium]|jgi:hypothetical protein|nr:two-component regulator propeller domain-containing protein [Planctomycetota bacterium]